MAVSLNVTFDDGAGGDITIPGPVPGSSIRTVKHQATGLTAGGTRYAYDKGVTRYELDIEFTTLSDTDKDDLQTFFDTTIDGVVNTFDYTDTQGDTFVAARFLNTTLEWEKVARGVWSTRLSMELPSVGD